MPWGNHAWTAPPKALRVPSCCTEPSLGFSFAFPLLLWKSFLSRFWKDSRQFLGDTDAGNWAPYKISLLLRGQERGDVGPREAGRVVPSVHRPSVTRKHLSGSASVARSAEPHSPPTRRAHGKGVNPELEHRGAPLQGQLEVIFLAPPSLVHTVPDLCCPPCCLPESCADQRDL